jgi:hypothetical protein
MRRRTQTIESDGLSVLQLHEPNFEPVRGGWIQQGYLPKTVAKELRQSIRNTRALNWMTQEHVDFWLNITGEVVQMVQHHDLSGASGPRAIHDEMAVTLQAVRQMRQAMANLNRETISTFNCHFMSLQAGIIPAHRVSDKAMQSGGKGTLRTTWQALEDIETGLIHAMSRLTTDYVWKPADESGKSFVFNLARRWKAWTEKLPPRNKGTWFPEYVEIVGRHYRWRCGLTVTRGVVARLASDPHSL